MSKDFNKIAYNNLYNATKYDSLRITVPIGQKDIIKQHCAAFGYKSLNAFVNEAIANQMANDKSK